VRFWDSSALVPLLVIQPTTRQTRKWAVEDREFAVWCLTETELFGAIGRLVREKAVPESQAIIAEKLTEELLNRATKIADIEGVKVLARRMLRIHELRAADALQLGAALAWSNGSPSGRVLHTFDRRLASAARREGFTVPAA